MGVSRLAAKCAGAAISPAMSGEWGINVTEESHSWSRGDGGIVFSILARGNNTQSLKPVQPTSDRPRLIQSSISLS
jgi:hypothetical protein